MTKVISLTVLSNILSKEQCSIDHLLQLRTEEGKKIASVIYIIVAYQVSYLLLNT
jgi:hypothetical protein